MKKAIDLKMQFKGRDLKVKKASKPDEKKKTTKELMAQVKV
jgi:hypothetical protein